MPQRELYEALEGIHQECLNYVATVRPLLLSNLYFFMLDRMAEALTSMVFFTRPLSQDEAIQVKQIFKNFLNF